MNAAAIYMAKGIAGINGRHLEYDVIVNKFPSFKDDIDQWLTDNGYEDLIPKPAPVEEPTENADEEANNDSE